MIGSIVSQFRKSNMCLLHKDISTLTHTLSNFSHFMHVYDSSLVIDNGSLDDKDEELQSVIEKSLKEHSYAEK